MQPTDKPYIAPPERAEIPPMNTLVCFLDKDRGCGSDCMSYAVNTPGENYNDQWCHCIVMTSLFRISKHLVVMAQQGAEKLNITKTMSSDIARAANSPQVPQFVPPMPKKVDP